jgi:hypothetical protein
VNAKFARVVFLIAAIWGFSCIPPLYFLEERIGREAPPAITHPEYFYGFIGVTLAFQVVFLILSRDPVRYRSMMIPAVIEKATFVLACAVLYVQGRVPGTVAPFAGIDLLLGLLFTVAYLKTRTLAFPAAEPAETATARSTRS